MAGMASVSRAELSQRRKQLRRQRQVRSLKHIWRSLFVLGLTGGTVWIVTAQTNWVLRNPEQVTIKGNRFLSVQKVRSLLPIQYPQSLLKTDLKAIEDTLKAKAPIAVVIADRQLFPPSLTVRIQELKPIAQSFLTPPESNKLNKSTDKPTLDNPKALLDERGVIIPVESYTAFSQSQVLPELRVIGNPEIYQSRWQQVYPYISRSPVKVMELDWRNPSNLILQTELGSVHLGPLENKLQPQLRALDKMRKLGQKIEKEQISYLDLRNPENPIVQFKTGKSL